MRAIRAPYTEDSPKPAGLSAVALAKEEARRALPESEGWLPGLEPIPEPGSPLAAAVCATGEACARVPCLQGLAPSAERGQARKRRGLRERRRRIPLSRVVRAGE